MKKNKLKIILAFLIFILLYGASFLFSSPYGLRKNVTESLPYTYFLSYPCKSIAINDYVMFDHPLSPIPLAKRVIGLEGDQIAISEMELYINGESFGKILPKCSLGKELNPLSEGYIPQGYFFAYADHPQSFDSRYAEFGLIPIDQIQELLWPIF